MPVPSAPARTGMPADHCRLQVNGVVFAMNKGEISPKTELTKSTNSESGGWRSSIPGERELTGSVEAKLMPQLNPHIYPLLLVDGALAYLEFFPVVGGATYSGWAWIHDVKINFNVPNEIPYSFSFTSEGAWAYPLGTTWTYPPA